MFLLGVGAIARIKSRGLHKTARSRNSRILPAGPTDLWELTETAGLTIPPRTALLKARPAPPGLVFGGGSGVCALSGELDQTAWRTHTTGEGGQASIAPRSILPNFDRGLLPG